MADDNVEWSAESQRLILLVESTLHFLVRQEMSRSQAIDLKARFHRPLGALNSRFTLRTDRETKEERLARNGHEIKPLAKGIKS